MKVWLIGTWKYKHDQHEDIEREVIANNFDDAYSEFRSKNPIVKIRFIQEIN